MNWRETSGDKRSQSPSLSGRRISEPWVEENRHCHSQWYSGFPPEGRVTNGLAGSFIRDHYNGSCLHFHEDEHFRKLSQFCESLQRESPSKKFRWENLFAKNPANANLKSSLGLKHVNGCGGDNRGNGVSGSHLGTPSKDILEGNNLQTFHMNKGGTSRSFGIDDCSHLCSSRKFNGSLYDTRRSDVHGRDLPTFEYKQARRNHIEHFDDCKRSDIGASINCSFSQKMVRIPQDDIYHDSTRTSVVVGNLEETRPRDHYDLSKEPFIIEGCYMGNAPFAMEQDGEVLGSGTGSQLKDEREAYISSAKLRLAEEDGYRTNYGQWWHGDGSLVSKHEQDLSDIEDSRKLRVEGTRCRVHYPESDSSKRANVFSRIQFLSHEDERSVAKDTACINLNCRNEDSSISLAFSKRPLPWAINHASRRPKSRRKDLKKQSGMSLRDPSSNPLVRGRESKRNKRLRKKNVNHWCLDVQTRDCLEEKMQIPTGRRPFEDPVELNQLIKSAFLKFVKTLSENSARRMKFTEPGSGLINCIVCGRKSKEFADALALSQHASQSLEGSRAEHLGLHKALCWLMGWSSEAAPNGVWVRRILPIVEALALKEDLIIWPPVLIIHNSSLAIDNSSERVAISCEELEVVIRGMGCGGKVKVVRGKPGNHSIRVATFGAMFSGLQEAERLHQSFADKCHGRDEFQKIKSSHLVDDICKELPEAVGANPLENVLYGYLGLAEDLDKLEFESKKRFVVKSKKEIQAIVNACL